MDYIHSLRTNLKFVQIKASLVQREVPAGRRDCKTLLRFFGSFPNFGYFLCDNPSVASRQLPLHKGALVRSKPLTLYKSRPSQ